MAQPEPWHVNEIDDRVQKLLRLVTEIVIQRRQDLLLAQRMLPRLEPGRVAA
jgi:hypothetical protein